MIIDLRARLIMGVSRCPPEWLLTVLCKPGCKAIHHTTRACRLSVGALSRALQLHFRESPDGGTAGRVGVRVSASVARIVAP